MVMAPLVACLAIGKMLITSNRGSNDEKQVESMELM